MAVSFFMRLPRWPMLRRDLGGRISRVPFYLFTPAGGRQMV
ncbi:hypothetical protein [Enorma burkinafasonensis]|nr:hypothetical protein [Enorma burkinafasonensis]